MALYHPRTTAQRSGDFPNSKKFEQLVGSWLPDEKIDQTDSDTEMDWLVGDIRVEVKEKNQRYNTSNWPLPPDTTERDAFIIDELSIHKALVYYPKVYFVLQDNPGGNRIFLAPIAHIICCKREMVDRVGKTGHKKGKWICDVSQFQEVYEPEHVWKMIEAYEAESPWFKSACLLPNH